MVIKLDNAPDWISGYEPADRVHVIDIPEPGGSSVSVPLGEVEREALRSTGKQKVEDLTKAEKHSAYRRLVDLRS